MSRCETRKTQPVQKMHDLYCGVVETMNRLLEGIRLATMEAPPIQCDDQRVVVPMMRCPSCSVRKAIKVGNAWCCMECGAYGAKEGECEGQAAESGC